MDNNNISSLSPTLAPVEAQLFILPKQKQQEPDPLVEYLYSAYFVDEVSTSTCPKCKVKRVRRTVAEGRIGKGQNPCWIAFDFCPSCRRVKADTPHQKKLMALVTNVKPLAKEYVERKKKFQEVGSLESEVNYAN